MCPKQKRQNPDISEATTSKQNSLKADSDNETAILTNPTGTLYPATGTNDFGETPVQTIEYLQVNKIVAPPVKKNVQMEENVRVAKLKLMADLRTILNETCRDRELFATTIAL